LSLLVTKSGCRSIPCLLCAPATAEDWNARSVSMEPRKGWMVRLEPAALAMLLDRFWMAARSSSATSPPDRARLSGAASKLTLRLRERPLTEREREVVGEESGEPLRSDSALLPCL